MDSLIMHQRSSDSMHSTVQQEPSTLPSKHQTFVQNSVTEYVIPHREGGSWADKNADTLISTAQTRPPRLLTLWSNGWIAEVLSCAFSLTALICLILVLHKFNGYVLTDMPLKISINTLVAVIAAVMKSSLLLPIAEGQSCTTLEYPLN